MNVESNLKTEVAQLIEDVNKTHRYSMSRIYGLWNRVFEKKEAPQSCASCLIRKMRELNKWMEGQTEPQETASTNEQPKKKTSKKKEQA